MAFATRRIALERLLLRRARQRSASIARARETSIATARAAGTLNVQVPAIFLRYADTTVRQLLSAGQRRGFVTFDELNDMLPAGKVSSDEIEAVFKAICGLGIQVTEN
jgi:hypothetical protein